MALEESSLLPSGSTKKSLYMFFMYSSGPIEYSLYAINMPNPLLPLPPLQPPSNHQSTELESEKTIIHPILEFPVGQYPEFICCVELDMKLFFFGGQFHQKGIRIGISMTLTRPMSMFSTPPPSLSQPVTVTAMINRKPNTYAFVPYKKIYAFATRLFSGQNCCALHNLLPEANVVPLLMQVFCEDASQFPLYYLAGGQCGLLLHAIARSNRTIAELQNLPLSKQWHW
ncbi:hypothetical protein LOK49_LG10G01793 [Camellia lanceoleosa]|uniref:Uncharacterized protein n=1 Tax=Camellia lanceoleosa TaxID=1840588 RepID=A0ACC0GBV7_9ERIC|nr:hypothetical protein LOK49_LG10G01793 [Camellia lanceoleosa]